MKKAVFILLVLFLLSSCSKDPGIAKQLTGLLSAVNEKENQGNNFVEKMHRQELMEQQLFTETMGLTQQQYADVKKHVAALKKSAHGRAVLIDKEESGMREAKEAIDRLADWVESEKQAKQPMEQVIRRLYERFELHEEFILVYKKLIDSQMQLYTQLEDRSIRERELQEYVNEVNNLTASSQRILVEFNQMTREANRLAARAVKSLEGLK